MPNYKITDNITGKSMVVNLAQPPKDDDVGHLFDNYYQGKEKINDINTETENSLTPFQKIARRTPDFITNLGKDTHKPLTPEERSYMKLGPNDPEPEVLGGTPLPISTIPAALTMGGMTALQYGISKGAQKLGPSNVNPNLLDAGMNMLGFALPMKMQGKINGMPPKPGQPPEIEHQPPSAPETNIVPFQPRTYNINTYDGPVDISRPALPPATSFQQSQGYRVDRPQLQILNRTSGIPMPEAGREYPTVSEPQNIVSLPEQQPIDPYAIGQPSANSTARFMGAERPELAVQQPTESPIIQPNEITGQSVQIPQVNDTLPFKQVENTPDIQPQKTVQYPPISSTQEGIDSIFGKRRTPNVAEQTASDGSNRIIVPNEVNNPREVIPESNINKSKVEEPKVEVLSPENQLPQAAIDKAKTLGLKLTDKKGYNTSDIISFKDDDGSIEGFQVEDFLKPTFTKKTWEALKRHKAIDIKAEPGNLLTAGEPNAETTIPKQEETITANKQENQNTSATETKTTENPFKNLSLEALTKLLGTVKNQKSKAQIQEAIESKSNEIEETTIESTTENTSSGANESINEPPKEEGTISDKEINKPNTAYSRAINTLDIDSLESAQQAHQAIRNGLIEGVPTQKILEDLIKKGMDDKVARRQVVKETASYNSQKGSVPIGEIASDIGKMGSKAKKTAKSILETTHEFLKESGNEVAKRIGETVTYNFDQERKWVGNFKAELRKPLKSLNDDEIKLIAQHLNGENPTLNDKLRQASESIRGSLNKAMDFFEQRQSETGVGFRKNGNRMGRLDDYLTHIKAEAPTDIWDGIKGFFDDLYPEGSGETNPKTGESINHESSLYSDKDIKNPQSGFAESRSTRPSDISYDLNKVLGTYAESMGRLAWRKPITEILGDDVNDIPDGRLKNVAREYIQQYSGIGEKQPLTDLARGMNNIDSRARMLANPRLWALHAGRLAPLFAQHDLPLKYFMSGAKKALSNPIDNYKRAIDDGLVPGFETGNRLFQTKMQKVNTIGSLWNFADAIPDMIAREAYKNKFLDEGQSAEKADNLAITAAKNSTLRIDPVRQSELFVDLNNSLKGMGRTVTQYKQTQFKIAEQYIRNSSKLFDSKLSAGQRLGLLTRLVGSTATAMYLTYKVGFPVFHARASAFNMLTAAAPEEWVRISKHLVKGLAGDENEMHKGIEDFLTYIIPAGRSQIKPLIETGEPKGWGEVGQKKSDEQGYPKVMVH